MSDMPVSPEADSPNPAFEWAGEETHAPASPIPPWRPPVDSPTSRKIIEAVLIELQSPQWTEQHYVQYSRLNAVVVGCSGGVDSVVLVHLLRHLRHLGKFDYALHVAHFNHQLRDDSHLDAEFVRDLAEKWELPFHLGSEPVENRGEGIEAAARNARYHFLRSHTDELLPTTLDRIIVTGHHADDQTETILLHLARGSGLEGLAAMRAIWWRMKSGDTVFRPLLRVRRSDIMKYARENALPWREDITNLDTRFDRNLVRHDIIPLLEELNLQVAPAMERLSRIVAHEAARLQRLSELQFKQERVEVAENTRLVVAVPSFLKLPFEDQIALLRHGVRDTFNRLWWRRTVADPGIDELENLARAIKRIAQTEPFATTGPHPWYDRLSWSTFIRPAIFGKRQELFSIHLSTEAPWIPLGPWVEDEDAALLNKKPTLPWSMTLQSGWRLNVRKLDLAKYGNKKRLAGAVWFDANAFTHYGLAVPLPGMKIAPLGMGGKHKSIGNLFTDNKIPTSVRHKWPLIIHPDTDEILWVSWLAQSEFGKVTPETTHVWEFQWRPETSRDHAENYDQFRNEQDDNE